MGLRRIVAVLAMGMVVFGPGPAAADDSAFNKEGFWSVGRGEADSKSCAASIGAKSGEMFLLLAEAGEVTFAVGAKKPMRRGKKGVLSTEAYSFEFEPGYGADGDSLFFDEPLNARVLAALRLASALIVTVDRRQVLNVDVEGTGFEGALDAVIACSNGKSGWWGPGVGAPPVVKAAEPETAVNKEGFWAVGPADDPGLCTAAAQAADQMTFVLIAGDGRLSFGVGSDKDFRRGRKGRFETDAYSFDFRPVYEDATYFYPAEDFDSQAAFALARAKSAKIRIDGREVVDMEFEDTGFAQVLTDLAACARGDKGWWGEGAKQP